MAGSSELASSHRASPPADVLWIAKGMGRGGIEQFLVRAAPHFDNTRFRLHLAYVLSWKDALVPDLERHGVQVHSLGADRSLDPRWVYKLRSLVRSHNFVLIHTHMPLPAVATRVNVGRASAVLHTEHNLWEAYRPLTYWANALSYGRNRYVFAVSDAVARSIRRPRLLPRWLSMPEVEVLAHGIDELVGETKDAHSRAREVLGLRDDELVIGTVGSLTPKKDQATLIDAAALLAPKHPSLRVVIVGGGRLEAQLASNVRRLGLEKTISMVGCRDDVLQILPAFDVFALSSRYEGLPLALVEAAATGLPCVATSVGGVSEVVEDGETGLLVPPADADALAGALDKLLRDPELRSKMGERATARAGRWNIVAAVERIQRVYDEVLNVGEAAST